MFKFSGSAVSALVALLTLGGLAAAATKSPDYGIGTPISESRLSSWDIDVNGLTGVGLPPGHGSVAQGAKVWEAKCAVCHGDFGEGAGRFPVLAGGKGTLTADRPVQTVGSYWPYAPTLFDYIRRAMPFPQPESLSNDEVYAVTAYILNLNDIVPDSAVMDASALASVKMPNRDGFIKAHWDTHNTDCKANCRPVPVKVTSDLVNLHVTPDEKEIGDVGSTVDMSSVATVSEKAKQVSTATGPQTPNFARAATIIAQRCTVCHSSHPTQSGFTSAPLGIAFDTPAMIKAQAAKIDQQAVRTHSMPLANMTHMTDAERAELGRWIAAGAPLQ